jgi:predicted nucleic acid-binding protein
VATRFYLDASALAKRYVVEQGTFVVNHLFRRVARDDMMCLTLGTIEVISVLVRKKNANAVPDPVFRQAWSSARRRSIAGSSTAAQRLNSTLLRAAPADQILA